MEQDAEFTTRTVKDGAPVKTYKARDIMHKIAEATWQCGDPGMQYDTTINRWHTSKNTARINASNPCSEYMFLDNSACNLASFNLLKFVTPTGTFDIPAYRDAIDIVITAMEILVDNSGYPTESHRPQLARLSPARPRLRQPRRAAHGLRPALRLRRRPRLRRHPHRHHVRRGLPAVRPHRRNLPAPRLRHAAQPRSVEHEGGACPGFYVNREPFLDVIRMHRAEVNNIGTSKASARALHHVPQLDAPHRRLAKIAGTQALAHGEKHGYRNSQVTVLAPTGTIGFMMDCDTTGIEPDLALVKYKKLVGGGMIKIVNNTVPAALFKLGYSDDRGQRHRQLHRRHRHHRRRARASSPSTSPSSTAPSSPPRAPAPSTTWATSR